MVAAHGCHNDRLAHHAALVTAVGVAAAGGGVHVGSAAVAAVAAALVAVEAMVHALLTLQ